MKFFKINLYSSLLCLLGLICCPGIINADSKKNMYENVTSLKSSLIGITFDNADGLPLWYDLISLKAQFKGKGQSIKIVVKSVLKKTDANITLNRNKTGQGEIYVVSKRDTIITPLLKRIDILKNQADVCYEGYLDNLKIVSFTIRYTVKDQAVYITMEDVIEQKGYELIEIQTNSLVSVYQTDGVAWLAHGDGGGYYTDLASAKPCKLKDGWTNYFPYFPNFNYLPLVMMGNGKVNSSMEVQGYLCNTQLEISNTSGQKQATMGVKSYYRVKGESSTSLLVGQKEICRLDFTGDYDNNNKTDWLDAAKAVRYRMPIISTHYYDDRMVWIISGQPGRAEKAAITFPDIEKVIKKISMLTDGVPQAVYISGWTEGGHDTGYPNVTKLNEMMGGLSGFKQLKEKAIPYDANISFDDNFDDQFVNEYTMGHYDEKYIARNVDGSLMQQRAWNGVDMSHITGMAKYMKDGGPGMERIRFTCQNYDLKHTELVDGLSWWSIRNDWDSINPASSVKNLQEGKFKIISEFKKYGVNIISELLRYPFVGKLALVVDGPDGSGWNGFGGTQIPLQRLVYSGSIIYGAEGGNGVARDPRLTLFHNCRRGPWIAENTPSSELMNYYYLNFLPWTKLHALDINTFQRKDQEINMTLSSNSSIRIDYSKDEDFSAVYNGIKIMEGNSITCPIDNKRIAFYSKTERKLSYPLPQSKNKERYKAKVLYDDRNDDFPYKIVNGNIEITVPASQPVIFCY